ncbi:YeeE/YedE family protein [Shewanella sp. VB17]|uniref:YeeE/YedE family protein n=1 Tax=Shewanella sp. VB17 TaxID=2739432 RepID=UPI0015644DAB|nr:YeeE/YedE thiosulfate transporter family protein [Shewanella sp. VB17]NRD73028.1 YeeE/YedE family protein [Shewanella sp. VB17]
MDTSISLLSLIWALLGGMLIGFSAIGLMVFNGRIAGISGILSFAIFSNKKQASEANKGLAWQWYFLFGLMLVGVVYVQIAGPMGIAAFKFNQVPTFLLVMGGLLVGLGSNLGSGCTSGHGICGIGRLSLRSIIATGVFMLTGIIAAMLVH